MPTRRRSGGAVGGFLLVALPPGRRPPDTKAYTGGVRRRHVLSGRPSLLVGAFSFPFILFSDLSSFLFIFFVF